MKKILIFVVLNFTLLSLNHIYVFSQYRAAETFLDGFEGTEVYIDTTGISNILKEVVDFTGRIYANKGFTLFLKEDLFEKQTLIIENFSYNEIKNDLPNKKEQFRKVEEK